MDVTFNRTFLEILDQSASLEPRASRQLMALFRSCISFNPFYDDEIFTPGTQKDDSEKQQKDLTLSFFESL